MGNMHDVLEVSKVLGLKPQTVRELIAQKSLVAVNVAPGRKLPRWRITDEALQSFIQGRATVLKTSDAVRV